MGPGTVIQISAAGQAQAAGRDIINHHHAKPQHAPRVTVTPGDGVISEEQKVALTALRNEWATLHAAIKKKPLKQAIRRRLALGPSDRRAATHLQPHHGKESRAVAHGLVPIIVQNQPFPRGNLAKLKTAAFTSRIAASP